SFQWLDCRRLSVFVSRKRLAKGRADPGMRAIRQRHLNFCRKLFLISCRHRPIIEVRERWIMLSKKKPTSRKKSAAAFAVKPRPTGTVKSLRQELGLGRRQFARLTAASERAVADWEKDQPISPVSQKSLRESERLCQALRTIMKPEY